MSKDQSQYHMHLHCKYINNVNKMMFFLLPGQVRYFESVSILLTHAMAESRISTANSIVSGCDKSRANKSEATDPSISENVIN